MQAQVDIEFEQLVQIMKALTQEEWLRLKAEVENQPAQLPQLTNEKKWFGIKLLYTNKVIGPPDSKLVDEHYQEDYIAYEESVIVVQASSFDEAFDKAEKVAAENEFVFQNIYGQEVHIKHHATIDCFLMNDMESMVFEDGVEVYSNIIESRESIDQDLFIENTFPTRNQPSYMLLNSEFSRSKAGKG